MNAGPDPRSVCRSCGAAITWTVTSRGKRMPVDAEPHPDGNIRIRHPLTGGPPQADVVPKGSEASLHRSHFATCPNAGQHRRRA